MKMTFLLIIIIVLSISCKNQNEENELPDSDQNEIVRKEKQEDIIEKTKVDKDNIVKQLQGKWKEMEYPYRTAEFVNSTLKFIEEGTANNPKFEKFEISEDCQFDNNNIRDLELSDIILTLPETQRCEKLMVSNDTLTLSGYSTNSNENYKIIYLRLK